MGEYSQFYGKIDDLLSVLHDLERPERILIKGLSLALIHRPIDHDASIFLRAGL
jgi:hypothetical protein